MRPDPELDYDPIGYAGCPDPYPAYAALRERAPLYRAPRSGMWCVSRHEDASFVLKHPELFSSIAMRDVLMGRDLGPIGPRYLWFLARFLWQTRIDPFAVQRAGNLVSMDPPRHDALRNVVNRGFAPRRIAEWEGRIRARVSERMQVLARDGAFDVVDDLAVPLPVAIIAEMLGVEAERHADFKRWSDAIIAVASGSAGENPVESGLLDHFTELFRYLKQAVRARVRDPRDDLIGVLVDPAQQEVLSELEVILFVVLLLVAGNETTTNLIGNAVNALLDHPAALQRVADDPSLVPALVEETLRFDAPIQLTFRTATRDVEVAGGTVPKGGVVAVLLGSANRDPERFPAPDCFDLDRDTRGHLAFGLGIHFCLGSSLARLEARVALEGLTAELPGLKPEGSRDEMIDSFLVRGRRHIRVVAQAGSGLVG